MEPLTSSPSPPQSMASFSDSDTGRNSGYSDRPPNPRDISSRSREPEGSYGTSRDTHGEDLIPTRQESFTDDDDGGELYEDESEFYTDTEYSSSYHQHSSHIFGSAKSRFLNFFSRSPSGHKHSPTKSASKKVDTGDSAHVSNSNSNSNSNVNSPYTTFSPMYAQQQQEELQGDHQQEQRSSHSSGNNQPSLLPLTSNQTLDNDNDNSHTRSRSTLRSIREELRYSSNNYDTDKPAAVPLRHSAFPSHKMLVGLVVFVVLSVAGFVAGLTYYSLEKKRLDPIRPPTGQPSATPPPTPGSTTSGGGGDDDDNPLLPTDDALLELFASALGLEASDLLETDETVILPPHVLAANWMLTEDPSKESPPRSDEAWIQRFLLVHLHYLTTTMITTDSTTDATTTTTTTTSAWLSCNPEASDDFDFGAAFPTDLLPDDGSGDACWFASPTELPSGNLRYDGWIPSNRWLTGTDECTWGGVACGTTVAEDVPVRTDDADTEDGAVPVNYRLLRTAVTSVTLAGQNLVGSLSETYLWELPHLRVLDLSHNHLVGTIGPVWSDLERLRLRYNALGGELPGGLFGIVEEDEMDDNNATSAFTSTLSPLVELDVGFNGLEGTLPADLGLVATDLGRLILSDNGFTGTIPVLGSMPLEVFRAPNNNLTGILPFEKDYGGTWPITLREWWTSGNALEGSIPVDLGRFVPNLHDLRLDGNELTGTVPDSIGELSELWRLDLSDNNLTGTLPPSLGEDNGNLRELRVQFNNLEGTVPTGLCFLESMAVLEADCPFGDLVVDNNNDNEEVLQTFGGDGRRHRRDQEVIPSFPTLEEAIAAARGVENPSPPSSPDPSTSEDEDPASPPSSPEAPSSSEDEEGTGVTPATTTPTTTELECYCCTKCCNADTGECLAYSTFEV